ncbi:MAG: glycoside hydrolase family 140 protein [Prolixibacteraceae bacterium]|nr:glycoside hydrolase family 140 protein [Prolixibacteraceae bacterium]
MIKQLFAIIITLNIACTLAAKSLPHLQISENKQYIENENGEPFLWIGDTAWELIHRLNRNETVFYLKDRADKGFNIIQTVILAELDGLKTPNANGDVPLIDLDPTRLNEDYFKHVDYVLKKAEKLGLYIALLPTWGDKFNRKWGAGPEIFNPDNAEKYCELLAKRYLNQSNIVWILGGDRMPESEKQYEIIKAMARGIRNVDQKHLISYHPVGGKRATDAFNDEWLDLDMFQSGHSRGASEYRYVWESKKNTPARPVINGEARYENIPDHFWEPGEHPWLDDGDVRLSAYWSLLAGAAGYTYGCNDIWQMYSLKHSPTINARTGWREAMQLPGSSQMKHVKTLFTAFPWHKMKNDQSIILNENPINDEFSMSAISENRDFMLAYTPWGRPIKVDLSKINAQNVNAFWFNPRSGESLFIGTFSNDEKAEFTPWASGRGSDFVLVVIDASNSYPLPFVNNL